MPEAGSSGQLDASVCSLYDPPIASWVCKDHRRIHLWMYLWSDVVIPDLQPGKQAGCKLKMALLVQGGFSSTTK